MTLPLWSGLSEKAIIIMRRKMIGQKLIVGNDLVAEYIVLLALKWSKLIVDSMMLRSL